MGSILGIPTNVFVLGLVSLFMDISSEMIYPLIPIFLSDVLQAQKTYIGLIEGIAEGTASILKVFSGWLSDRIGKRKKIIFWGYGISVFSRPILATATSWVHVLIYRFTDRVGKGVRTSPRDAIIADSTDKSTLGKAFGFHRSMDTLGAVIGPSLAFAMLGIFGGNLTSVFWLSIVPGLFALCLIIFFVKEIKVNANASMPKITFKGLDRNYKAFLFIVALFTLGKTSEVFLVLRSQELGVPVTSIPLLYLSFNIVSALLSTPSGIIADRIGKRKTIIASYVLFSLIFLGFAMATSQIHAWLLFLSYGLFVAMNEGVQRAYVGTIIKPEFKATGYGVYHTVVGLSALPSGLIGGLLWQNIGSHALFYYGAFLSILSCILFVSMLFPRNIKTI